MKCSLPVVYQIFFGDDAPSALNVFNQFIAQVAVVQDVDAVDSHLSQRAGQRDTLVGVALLQQLSGGFVKVKTGFLNQFWLNHWKRRFFCKEKRKYIKLTVMKALI